MTDITKEAVELATLKAAAQLMQEELLREIAKLKGHIAANDWMVETAYKMAETKAFNEGIEAAAQCAESFPYTGDPQSILGMRSRSIAAEIRALKRETK